MVLPKDAWACGEEGRELLMVGWRVRETLRPAKWKPESTRL